MENKVRIYELAKELNTNSKALIDKLKAINISVKNHMSILEEHELKAIYEYFGVNINNTKPEINHVANAEERVEKEIKVEEQKSTVDIKQEQGKSTKSAPRIIRTHVTEIRTDSLTGVTTEIHTEIKGDSRREVRTNIIKEPPKVEKPEFYEFRKNTIEPPVRQKQEVLPEVMTEKSAVQNNMEASKEELKKEIKVEVPEKQVNEPVNSNENISRRPATGERPQGNRSQYGAYNQGRSDFNRNQQNNAPQYNNNNSNASQSQSGGFNRPPQRDTSRPGERPPYNNNNTRPGERPPYNNTNTRPGERPPFNARPGERPTFNSRPGERPPYNNNNNNNYNNNNNRPSTTGPRTDADRRLNSQIEKSIGDKESVTPEVTRPVRRESVVKDKPKDTRKEAAKPQKGPVVKNDRKIDQNTLKTLSGGHKVNEILNTDSSVIMALYDEKGHRKIKKGMGKGKRPGEMLQRAEPVKVNLKVALPETITVKDLAERIKKQAALVIKKLLAFGLMATVNQEIDYDTASTMAEEFGYTVEKEIVISEEDILFDESEDTEENLETRAPVVVVMGHVDHGKTSLLDAIRETDVIAKEAGGITQHIGAYSVKIKEKKITFLDTPGHEAFTAMRARGAQVTDVAILVVAADDGVMPQTIEAIDHAKAANVSIIVAVNKIDKPGADADRVKQELMGHGLVAEEWGGDTIFVNVSAKKREGIDSLLEMVVLVADMHNLKANPNKQAKGTVIEAKLDKGRGPVATVLVQRGTLKVGDAIVSGATVGRVRAMIDDKGQKVKKARPSTPVEIIGLSEVPEAGDIFYVVEDEKLARQLAEKRRIKQREKGMKSSSKVTLDDLFVQIQQGKVKDLNIIVKADVQGSVEAIKQSMEKICNEEVRVKIIHGAVGAITESDVMLANVSNAIIIGFNVRPEVTARDMAEREKVDIKLYRVIYEALDDITAAMKGMREPKFREVILGHAEVRQIFKASVIGTIAGCYVTDGKITRNSDVRIIRNSIVVYEGKIASLKRFKEDIKEAATSYECGIALEKFNDIKEKDVIEAFTEERILD